MPWFAHYNPEIDWRTEEVKIMRCLEKCGKQWRSKQKKSGWKKQKEEERERERRIEMRKEEAEEERRENKRRREQWK